MAEGRMRGSGEISACHVPPTKAALRCPSNSLPHADFFAFLCEKTPAARPFSSRGKDRMRGNAVKDFCFHSKAANTSTKRKRVSQSGSLPQCSRIHSLALRASNNASKSDTALDEGATLPSEYSHPSSGLRPPSPLEGRRICKALTNLQSEKVCHGGERTKKNTRREMCRYQCPGGE